MKKLVLALGLLVSFLTTTISAGAITLADENTMRQQLESVIDPNNILFSSRVDNHIAETFHPSLLAYAGMQMSPAEVQRMFSCAVCGGVTACVPRPMENEIRTRLYQLLPHYVIAILPGNPAEAAEAIEMINKEERW